MKKRSHHYNACYYCVCTACSRIQCPFKRRVGLQCYACSEQRQKRPRLECDYFTHYLKHKRFKFKREVLPLPEHHGTYILTSDNGVYVGSWDRLVKVQRNTGGQLRRLNIIDYNFGGL